MNIWILVFARILDCAGWMAGWFFWIFRWFFFGSLDQVFLLDIGVLVSINLTYTNILLKFKVCKRTNA